MLFPAIPLLLVLLVPPAPGPDDSPIPGVRMETAGPPPALLADPRGPPPSGASAWIDGHWQWAKGRWAWVPGEWAIPPGRPPYMGIKMDSRTPQEPKPDADQNLAIQLLKLVAPPEAAKDYEDRLRAGGLGYGDLKKGLFEHYWNYFAAARARRAELEANLDYVKQVLADGASRARAVARTVLERCASGQRRGVRIKTGPARPGPAGSRISPAESVSSFRIPHRSCGSGVSRLRCERG